MPCLVGFGFYETGFHIAQAAPELICSWRMIPNSEFSCLYLQSVGITGMNSTPCFFIVNKNHKFRTFFFGGL